jgi:hypothetical protein
MFLYALYVFHFALLHPLSLNVFHRLLAFLAPFDCLSFKLEVFPTDPTIAGVSPGDLLSMTVISGRQESFLFPIEKNLIHPFFATTSLDLVLQSGAGELAMLYNARIPKEVLPG